VPLETVDIPPKGRVVHLKAYGFVKVFRIVSKDGDTQHWVTDMQEMEEPEREDLAKKSWKIEEYHRGIKQFCGVEKCQAKKGRGTKSTYNVLIQSFF